MPISAADAAAERPAAAHQAAPHRRFKRARIKTLAKPIIVPGSTVVTDGYPCFHGVTDAGCAHVRITTGSGPRAARYPAFKWVNTMLGNIKASLVGTYRAIRKKHIVRYLAVVRVALQSSLRYGRHDPSSRTRRGACKTSSIRLTRNG